MNDSPYVLMNGVLGVRSRENLSKDMYKNADALISLSKMYILQVCPARATLDFLGLNLFLHTSLGCVRVCRIYSAIRRALFLYMYKYPINQSCVIRILDRFSSQKNLPKSRSVLQDKSNFLGLFWR